MIKGEGVMVDKAKLKSDLKTAATVAMTAAATTFGAPNVQAAETEMDTEAHTEMYAPNASSMDTMGENDISFAEAAAEYGYSSDDPWMYRNGDEYARAHGLRRDTRLSRGLQRPNRDFAGYAGAYIDPTVRPNEVGYVLIIPNDIQRDSHHIGRMTLKEAQYWQANGGRGYDKPREHPGQGYGSGYGYGYGNGRRASEIVRDVEDVVHGVGHVIRDIGNIFGGGRGGRGR